MSTLYDDDRSCNAVLNEPSQASSWCYEDTESSASGVAHDDRPPERRAPRRCMDAAEAELVAACRRQCSRAQGQVYREHAGRIMSLMIRMTGDYDDAFDLAQQAFVRVFNRIHTFRGESPLGTWIHRVAVNEALQHLRRKKRFKRIMKCIIESPSRKGPPAQDPSLSMDVRTALDRLPERGRQMVMMRYHRGMGYADIAEALGVATGTVASGLNRACNQLRHILQ
jgi:RNA polymerase sigma-70 factor (ECF subfamily)